MPAEPLDSNLAQSLAEEHKDVTHGTGNLEGGGDGAKEHKVVGGAQEGHGEVSRTGNMLLAMPQPRLAPNILKT